MGDSRYKAKHAKEHTIALREALKGSSEDNNFGSFSAVEVHVYCLLGDLLMIKRVFTIETLIDQLLKAMLE